MLRHKNQMLIQFQGLFWFVFEAFSFGTVSDTQEQFPVPDYVHPHGQKIPFSVFPCQERQIVQCKERY